MQTNNNMSNIKQNKKKKKVFIAFVVVIIIGILIYFRPAPEWLREMVLENKEDYMRIAELYYNDYLDNHERLNEEIMAYSNPSGVTIYSCSDDPGRVIELSEEEIASAYVVLDTYKMSDSKELDRVYVYDNFVAFCTVNGGESIVYSVNGRWPSYVNSPDANDPKFIWVLRISNHWYYCRRHFF